MDDAPLHERMTEYEQLAEEAADAARKRDTVATEIGDRLAETIADAVEAEGATIEQTDQSADGQRYQFTARLDRAALVATLTDTLPDGFVVSHVNDDGTLSVEWTGEDRTPSARARGAVLKAIVDEETVTDSDGLIESVPTRDRVLARASDLGIDDDEAASRLNRLAVLGVVELVDDRVYPDENFSRY